MHMIDLIHRKRDGFALSKDEIEYLVSGYVKGEISDFQMSSLLMAIYFQGMTSQETLDLTLAMANSGEQIDLSKINGFVVDKHSTGGVADTTTLLCTPLVAACGVKVAKMSGRGLGHTGGTIDKLESIPGFNANISSEDFQRILQDVGCAVAVQSDQLVPADKKMYALRDVTGTVGSLPLIASSIMSKKIACGSPSIVLDVKCGNGAFMEKTEDAMNLAREMVNIGHGAGRKISALVTDMNQPLGCAIGNALEVFEAVEILQGKRDGGNLLHVSIALATEMLCTAGAEENHQIAKERVLHALHNGKGFEKLCEMVKAQGGDDSVLHETNRLPQAKIKIPVVAIKDGVVARMQTKAIGQAARLLGAGRMCKEEVIDPAVGIWMHKQCGDEATIGETLAVLYVNDDGHVNEVQKIVQEAIVIEKSKPKWHELIIARVTPEGIERGSLNG